jgi:capsular exopolysaccharide synthesis family protein
MRYRKHAELNAGRERGGYVDLLRQLRSRNDVARGYEALVGNLQLTGTQRRLRSLLLTSSHAGEGKTTVTVTLALALSLTGKRVLVVDGDVRNPDLHRVLDLDNGRGFGDLLTGNVTPEDLPSVQQSVEIPDHEPAHRWSLSAITGGKAEPVGFATLPSEAVKDALARLTPLHDLVVFDSSAVLAAADALLFAPLVDGVLLVVRAGLVSREEAQRAKERIEAAGGHIVGVVVNHFDDRGRRP